MQRKTTYWLALLIVVFAFFLRVWGLERDAPPLDLLRDEAPWTDEGTISRDPLETINQGKPCYDLAFAGGRSIHKIMLCGVFRYFDVGRIQGRWLSVFIGMIGLLSLRELGSEVWADYGGILAFLVVGTGFFFVVYDRLILTEGILVALLSLTFLVAIKTQNRFGSGLIGVGLGVLIMGFKLHALALVPALVFFYWLRRRHMVFPFIMGLGLMIFVWRVVLMPRASISQVVYVPSRMVDKNMGLAGLPTALLQVVWAGLPVYYFPYQLPLMLFSVLEGTVFLLRPSRWLRKTSDVSLISLVWFIFALVGASAFKYYPARYYHFASPPLVILSVAGMRRLWEGCAFPSSTRLRRWMTSIGLGSLFMIQVFYLPSLLGEWAFMICIIGSLAPILLFRISSKSSLGWGYKDRVRRAVFAFLLLIQITIQGALFHKGVVMSRPDLPDIAAQLASDLPNDALVTGRLAGTLALSGDFTGLPILDEVSLIQIEQLAKESPVWIVVLEGDQWRVDSRLWSYLVDLRSFPVRYSRKSRSLEIWRFEE